MQRIFCTRNRTIVLKYVVTGGAGFVGNHLVKLLIKEGHEVIVIDNLYKGKKENLEPVLSKIQFEQIDIRDYSNLERILKDIDGVFHQAALTVVQDSFDNPEEYHDVNVKGTENIFQLANEYRIIVIIFWIVIMFFLLKKLAKKDNDFYLKDFFKKK